MRPKFMNEVGDLVLISAFISLTVILLSTLTLSYPLENLEEGSNEAENLSLKKRTSTQTIQHLQEKKAHTYKCEFEGNVALKNHCIRYLVCTKVGTLGLPRHCANNKHFDFIKRMCINKEEAQCESAKVCPDDFTGYSVGTGYLQCKDGVPYPKIGGTCPVNMAFDEKKNKCVAKEGENMQTGNVENMQKKQVIQVNAYQVDNGKEVKVEVNKTVIPDMFTQSVSTAGYQQQQMDGRTYQNQNLEQTQNIAPLLNINVGTSPDQNTGPYQNQNADVFSNQNLGLVPNVISVLQLNPDQDDNREDLKVQINENPDRGTQNLNAADPQQPMMDRGPFSIKNGTNIVISTSPLRNTSTKHTPNNYGLLWNHGIPAGVATLKNSDLKTYPNGSVILPVRNPAPENIDKSILGPFATHHVIGPSKNENTGSLNNQNMQTQVQVSTSQKENGKEINLQVNQNTQPSQNVHIIIGPELNQSLGPSPNQSDETMPKQHIGLLPDENKVILNFRHNTRPVQTQNAVTIIPNLNTGRGPKRNQSAVIKPNQNKDPPRNISYHIHYVQPLTFENAGPALQRTTNPGSPKIKVKMIQVEDTTPKSKAKNKATIIKVDKPEQLTDANQTENVKLVNSDSLTSASTPRASDKGRDWNEFGDGKREDPKPEKEIHIRH